MSPLYQLHKNTSTKDSAINQTLDDWIILVAHWKETSATMMTFYLIFTIRWLISYHLQNDLLCLP